MTFIRKFPLTLSLLGSSAKINEGILIVQVVIKLRCIGKARHLPIKIEQKAY